jgi:hypothetical protein
LTEATPDASNVSADLAVDHPFRKYIKMKEMLPEGAVRQKMTADGFSSSDIDNFFSGRVSHIEIASRSLPTVNLTEVKLSTPTPKSSPLPPAKMSLLEEIQKGPKLKAVVVEDVKEQRAQATGGLLGMLAMEMSKRRFNMNVKDEEDDDSDGGFSSSDDSDSEDD